MKAWKFLPWLLVLVGTSCVIPGCGDSDSGKGPDVAQDGSAICGGNSIEPVVRLATKVSFGVDDGQGNSPGFNLDKMVSDGSDEVSCNILDFTDPKDGTPGIDNQFAGLWKVIVDVVGDAVEGLLQGVINDGSLLMIFEMEGVEDMKNDACITINLFNGAGKPDLTTENKIAPNQTFDRKVNSPFSKATNGKIKDGIVTAGPFEAVVPIAIFQVFFDLRIHDAYIRAKLNEDGTMTGMIGGGVEVEQILEIGAQAAAMDSNASVINSFLPNFVWRNSDLAYNPEDGKCHQLSSVLTFETTPAFVFKQ
jgi:hypothetical protein